MLGNELLDSRDIEKVLVILLEKFEPFIASLENTKDLSKITLAELLNVLQAQEQEKLMRQIELVKVHYRPRCKTIREAKIRNKKEEVC